MIRAMVQCDAGPTPGVLELAMLGLGPAHIQRIGEWLTQPAYVEEREALRALGYHGGERAPGRD